MTLRVMSLDMRKLGRLAKSWVVPVTMPHPFVNRWISRPNVPDVGLEVLDVDCVETDCSGEEADICFCDSLTMVIRARRRGELRLDSV